MLVLMTVLHLSGPAAGFIYEAIGHVSAAEWFVFLSGLVAGLIHSRYADRSASGRTVQAGRLAHPFHPRSSG